MLNWIVGVRLQYLKPFDSVQTNLLILCKIILLNRITWNYLNVQLNKLD